MTRVRRAEPGDAAPLARLWHDGWQDAHAAIVPEALALARTRTSFFQRMEAALDDVRAVGPVGAPLGFSLLKCDELNQLYVMAAARGAGVGSALIADAEQQLSARGVSVAWLACAIGNDRAARFYQKQGWQRAATVSLLMDLPTGPLELPVWRYEKRLAGSR